MLNQIEQRVTENSTYKVSARTIGGLQDLVKYQLIIANDSDSIIGINHYLRNNKANNTWFIIAGRGMTINNMKSAFSEDQDRIVLYSPTSLSFVYRNFEYTVADGETSRKDDDLSLAEAAHFIIARLAIGSPAHGRTQYPGGGEWQMIVRNAMEHDAAEYDIVKEEVELFNFD